MSSILMITNTLDIFIWLVFHKTKMDGGDIHLLNYKLNFIMVPHGGLKRVKKIIILVLYMIFFRWQILNKCFSSSRINLLACCTQCKATCHFEYVQMPKYPTKKPNQFQLFSVPHKQIYILC